MADRLLFWIDKVIYMLEDTMPTDGFDCPKSQMAEVKELKKIRKWVVRVLAK